MKLVDQTDFREQNFMVVTVSQDGTEIGIDHPTDADWNDVFRAHISLRDRMNERIAEMDKCPFKATAITDLEALVGELGEALRPYLAVLAEKPQKANWTDRYCDARDQLESVARPALAKREKARG